MELLYHAIMGFVFTRIPETIAYRIDFGAFCFFLGAILFQQMTFAFWVLKVTRYRSSVRRGEHDYLNDEIFKSYRDFENEKLINQQKTI